MKKTIKLKVKELGTATGNVNFVVVTIMGNEVWLPITRGMDREICNKDYKDRKIILTIEVAP